MTPTLTVYTAVVGTATDALREPAYVAPGVCYVCGTDQPVPAGSAWVRQTVDPTPDPVTTARRFKVLLHETCRTDLYLWVDAAFSLEVDPRIFVPLVLRRDLLVLPHPFCSTLRDEAKVLAGRGLAGEAQLTRQIADYESRGFPADHPHSSTGFLVRRNDRRTGKFNRLWWEELTRYPHKRDQMSFDYVAWKAGMQIGRLEGEYRANPYATWGERQEAAA